MGNVYAPGSFPIVERLKPFPPFETVTLRDYHRFWNFTARSPACWLWTGRSECAGGDQAYGRFSLQNSLYMAHRVAYFLHHKHDPGRELVLHTCDVSLCVNHDHLYLGDHDDNMRDRSDRAAPRIGSWNAAARLDEADIPVILRRYAEGESLKTIGDTYGVCHTTIHDVVSGRTWLHVPR